MERREALVRRVVAQQLVRPPVERSASDTALLDLGVQNSGRDGASWALVNRGVPLTGPGELEDDPDLALVWTLRGAPHYYRRADLAGVLDATSPFDDADARKRTLDAGRQLAAAGVGMREGLAVVATAISEVVGAPMPKGDVSGALNARLPDPYLRWCRPCQARHLYEQPFRFGALYAGVELTPGTSPPVLRPVPGWRRAPGPGDPERAPARLDVIENYLRFLGPATPADVAAFLDAPVALVRSHWPDAAVEVDVEGRRAWVLPAPPPAEIDDGLVRLLGPFDLFLQGRDRELIVPDRTRHKTLWPTLGRPGAVLLATDVVGVWRPRAAGTRLTVTVDLWQPVPPAVRTAVQEQAERLAAHRGVRLTGVPFSP